MQDSEEDWVLAVQFLSKLNKAIQITCKTIKPQTFFHKHINTAHEELLQEIQQQSKVLRVQQVRLHSVLETGGKDRRSICLLSLELAELTPFAEPSLQHTTEMQRSSS